MRFVCVCCAFTESKAHIFDKTVVVMHMQLDVIFFFDRLLDTSTESVLYVKLVCMAMEIFYMGQHMQIISTHQDQTIQIGFHNWWLLSLTVLNKATSFVAVVGVVVFFSISI